MSTATRPDAATVLAAPKVLLHDHLDGGVRSQTILEIADEIGYAGLPAHDAASLGTWFHESADSGSLERYLETFTHTVAVMQTEAGLARVAKECVLDLAADGVVGDICTVLLREDGSYADIAANERATGLTPGELARVPRRICVVADPLRAPAVVGALRAGVATDLVLDEATARATLRRL